MTIGIAAFGRDAGLAIFRGLQALERVASGAIGGFVSYAAITGDGQLARFATQRGGTRTLFVDADVVGADPPAEVAGAGTAALISSGPDRPEPLGQFIAGDPGVGLVTGHRFPQAVGRSGLAFNEDVLRRLASGADPATALDNVLAENPEADVGLIAVDAGGRMHGRNTDRVDRRVDAGQAARSSAHAAVMVLHNAIHPSRGVAEMVAEVAMEAMECSRTPDFWVVIAAGTGVVAGDTNALHVDAEMRATKIFTVDETLVRGTRDGAAVYLGAEVIQEGHLIGRTVTEPYVVLDDGVICTLSGQTQLRVGCRTED